jgi:hypothetical protein
MLDENLKHPICIIEHRETSIKNHAATATKPPWRKTSGQLPETRNQRPEARSQGPVTSRQRPVASISIFEDD